MEECKTEYDEDYIRYKVNYYRKLVEDMEDCIVKIKNFAACAKQLMSFNSHKLHCDDLYGEYYNKFIEHKKIWYDELKLISKKFSLDFYDNLEKKLDIAKEKLDFWVHINAGLKKEME